MKLASFDYDLPDELIAQKPLDERDASRMLVLRRSDQSLTHSRFQDFPNFIAAGDVVVLNNTRVCAARLRGKTPGGGSVELFLIRQLDDQKWEALARPARRLKPGLTVELAKGRTSCTIIDKMPGGSLTVSLNPPPGDYSTLENIGEPPLPPYIERKDGPSLEDRVRYQTVYSKVPGAIAAPTAGLHFTERILTTLTKRRALIAEVTLHVGYGTFEPVRVENVKDHTVRSEWFEITSRAADIINEARSGGKRIWAVGSTTTRALESASSVSGIVSAGSGFSSLTILPGYQFKAVDGLLTNFHLPRSSLLLLVSAFAGTNFTLTAYKNAVKNKYRFYSFGDSMLII